MSRTLVLLFATLFTLPVFARGECPRSPTPQEEQPLIFSKPWVGYTKNGEYHLRFNFGIEQWEEGKKSTFRFQQWYLLCTWPSESGDEERTWCSLTRTVFDDWGTRGIFGNLGTYVQSYNHYLEDGTLLIRNADWKNGKLDLAVVYTAFKDETPTEVQIRLLYEKDEIYLNLFRAFTIARGIFSDAMGTIEYRIPEYDYTMEVPVRLRGMKSEETRKSDEFRRSLSAKDWAIWSRLEPTLFDSLRPDEVEVRRKVLPGWDGKRELSAQEEKLLEQWMRDRLVGFVREKLAGSGISPEGEKKILDYLSSAFSEK